MTRTINQPFESGVDWITVSAFAGNNAFRLETRSRRLIRQQVKFGSEEKPWAMSGYTGLCAEGVQFGLRGEDALCRLSSDVAHDNWRVVHAVSDNCSRLDLQVTVQVDQDVQSMIHAHFKQAKLYSKSLVRGPKVTIVSSTDDATTLYLGDRTSDKFGRCYNKAKESGLDYYQQCVRYEVEYKNETARLLARELAGSADAPARVASHVYAFFSGRGCRLGWQPDTTVRLCRPRNRPDVSRRLEWLGTHVRGTVLWLCQRGMGREVVEALGLHEPPVVAPNSPE